MRGRCIGNSPFHLKTDELRAAYAAAVHQESVDLEIGREYQIFGLTFQHGALWYLVLQDDRDTYPVPDLAAFFDLVDADIPADWSLGFTTQVGDISVLPSRWAKDPRFMEKLVDGVPEEVEFLRKLQRKTRAERLAES